MRQKYFIAIVPPTQIADSIYEIKKSVFLNYKSKGALRSPAHITLHMPFSFDDDKEGKLITVLSQFKFKSEVPILLINFNCFEPRVVFIDVQQNNLLTELQLQLVKHCKTNLQLFNQADDKRGFHPHVTIAFRDLKKQQFYEVWNEYESKTCKYEFKSNSICLLKQVADNWIVFKEFSFTI